MTRRTKGGTRISDKDEEIYEPGSEIESLGDETSRSSANSESEGDSFKGSISDDELFSGDEQTYFSNDIESYSDYEADEQLEDTSLGEGEEEFSDFDSYITTISPSLLGSRPASTLPADGEEESTAQKIIESLSNILPEVAYAEPAASPTIMTTLPIPSSAQPIRMTDLGFKISQMVLNKRETTTQTASTQIGPLVDVSSVFGEQEDMEDMVAEGEDPLLERTLSGRRRNRTGIRGRPKKVDYGFGKSTTHVLPPPIAKLMGQANMAYVSRRYEEATQLLLEVVRQAPHAYEAYQTLGMIHEEMSDFEKAISYFVIAVHLGKHDVDLWRKLADLTLKLGRHQEAIYYLGRLIRMKNPLPEYFWTRARLWAEREDYKKAIQGFHRLLLVEIQGNGILFNQVLCFAERVEMSDIALDLFVQVIKEAVTNQRIPSFAVTLQVLAALDGRQEWDRITALIELLAVPIAANSGQSSISSGWFALSEEDRRMIALSELPLEVRLCYDIARLHLKQEVTVEYASRIEVPRYGGQLFKLGKALLSQTRAKEALGLLFPLLDVPQFANADLGALLGECYRLIPGQEQTALDTLETVLLVDPARNDVRNAMIDLYRQMGNMERAVKTMEGLTGEEPVEIFENRLGQGLNALFEGLYSWDRSGISTPEGGSQAILHLPDYAPPRKRSGRRRRRRLRKYSSFTPQQQQATQAVFVRIPTLYAARDPVSLRSLKQITVPLIEDMLGNPFIRPPEDSKIISNTTDLALLHGLTIIQWRSVLVHYLIAEEKVGSPERALKILRILLGKSVFLSDPDSHWTLRLLHVRLAVKVGRTSSIMNSTRWFIRTHPSLLLTNNLFHCLLRYCPAESIETPYYRFLERQTVAHDGEPFIWLMYMNLSLYTERYDSAIRAGMKLLHLQKSLTEHVTEGSVAQVDHHAYVPLASAFLHQSTKRTCRNASELQLRAFALMHVYHSAAGRSPQATYNLARAYHMMGLFPMAVKYYRSILKHYDAAIENVVDQDVLTATAHNLHLIALMQGEPELASFYLKTYNVK